jgi:PKHD-type hydroxylase
MSFDSSATTIKQKIGLILAMFSRGTLALAYIYARILLIPKIKPVMGRVGKNRLDSTVRFSVVRWLQRTDFRELTWFFNKLRDTVESFSSNRLNTSVSRLQADSFQLTEYSGSGHYAWHRDFGSGNNFYRRITASLQLSNEDSYSDGNLELHTPFGSIHVPRQRGTLVLFTSNTRHRVSPVTTGIRRSLVGWYVE